MTFRPVQQYKIAVTGTASTALAIALIPAALNKYNMQAILYAKDIDIVAKLGDDTVVADATATSSALVAGNFTTPNGAVMIIGMEHGQTHISAISEDESSSGTLHVTVGYNEA